MKKRMLSALLALCMMLTMVPAAFAVDTNDSSSPESVSTTLPEAVDGVYTLNEDVTLQTAFTVGNDENITIDLNGHKLSSSSGHTIVNYGTLSIMDGQTGGELVGNNAGYSALQNEPGAIATIESGSITKSNNSSSNDYYVITNHGTLTINGGTITSQSSHSSAIENGWYTPSQNTAGEYASLTINGGEVSAPNASGGLYTLKNDDYGIMVINAGTFNNSTTGAGTVLNWNDLTINGGTFNATNAAVATMVESNVDGDPAHAYELGRTIITGGTFNGTLSTNAAYQTGITVIVSGGTFSQEVPSQYVATGYTCTSSDSKWVVGIAQGIEADANASNGTANATVGGIFSGNESDDNVSTVNGTLTVTATTGDNSVTTSNVTIANATMSSINAAAAVQNVAIKTDVATLTVDSDAWNTMTEYADGSNVVLSVEKTDAEGSSPLTYTITAKAGSNDVFSSDDADGTVIVSVPYTGTGDGDPAVYYVGENGLENMNATLNGGNLFWEVSHFSDYVVLNPNTVATVTIGDDVTEYSTLEAAIVAANAAASDATVIVDLLKTVIVKVPADTPTTTRTGALNIRRDMTINGHTYTIAADTDTFKLADSTTGTGAFHVMNIEGGTVVINDLTVNGSNRARHGINIWTAAANVDNRVSVTLNNVTCVNNTGYGIVSGGSDLTVNEVITVGNTWGGINVDNTASSATGGTFTMNDGTLNEDNALYIENTKGENSGQNATINGGMFNGAVSVKDNAPGVTLTVTNGTFSNSVADYVSSNLKYEVSGTVGGKDTYTYYAYPNDAQQAASEMENAVVKVVGEKPYDTVTLDYNDGTEVDIVYVVANDTYILPASPTRDDYEFDGWYADGATEPVKTYTAVGGWTVTFTAHWDRSSSGGGGGGSSTYSVSVPSTDHGTVTVSPRNASRGATVTITVTPDTGYELGTLNVTDASGNRISLTNAGNGKYTFTMPSSRVTVNATFTEVEDAPEQVGSFTDVHTNDWFADAVQYMLDNGMMNGTSATTFSPNTTTTRGMIVTILHRLENEPSASASSFTDVVSGAYYTNAVNWAAANGIVNGVSATSFAPNDPITREQMAAILYRYAQFKGYDVTASGSLTNYTDASQISAYATTAMQWANAEELITGVTSTTLQPKGSATRAQVATILMRFCENIAG